MSEIGGSAPMPKPAKNRDTTSMTGPILNAPTSENIEYILSASKKAGRRPRRSASRPRVRAPRNIPRKAEASSSDISVLPK